MFSHRPVLFPHSVGHGDVRVAAHTVTSRHTAPLAVRTSALTLPVLPRDKPRPRHAVAHTTKSTWRPVLPVSVDDGAAGAHPHLADSAHGVSTMDGNEVGTLSYDADVFGGLRGSSCSGTTLELSRLPVRHESGDAVDRGDTAEVPVHGECNKDSAPRLPCAGTAIICADESGQDHDHDSGSGSGSGFALTPHCALAEYEAALADLRIRDAAVDKDWLVLGSPSLALRLTAGSVKPSSSPVITIRQELLRARCHARGVPFRSPGAADTLAASSPP